MAELKLSEGEPTPKRVDLEEERKKREQPPKPPKKTTAKAAPATPRQGLEQRLASFYETLVGGMYFVDSDVADFQADHIKRLAATQAAWAKENRYVRQFLETMTAGGIAAAAIGETVIVVGGSIMIVQAKRGQLNPQFAPAAAFFGVPLPPQQWLESDGHPSPSPPADAAN